MLLTAAPAAPPAALPPLTPQLHCHQAVEPIAPAAVGLGIFLVAGTLIGALPQMLLLCRRRSSAGMSMLTYAMAATYGTMNLVSTLTVKWPTLLSCKEGLSCLVQLLDAQQMVVSCFTLSTVMLLCVAFPPGNTTRLRLLAAATMLVNVSLLAVGYAISVLAPCSRLSLDFASGLSLLSGIVVSVAFAPQVVTTYRARGRGSISYIYFFIQAAGCGLVVGFQFFSLHDSCACVWTRQPPHRSHDLPVQIACAPAALTCACLDTLSQPPQGRSGGRRWSQAPCRAPFSPPGSTIDAAREKSQRTSRLQRRRPQSRYSSSASKRAYKISAYTPCMRS